MSEHPKQPKRYRMKVGESELDITGDDDRALLELCRKWLEQVREKEGQAVQAEPEKPAPDVPSKVVGRVFTTASGSVRLKELPEGENTALDTLLILLWGFYRQMDRQNVPAVDLINAARESGLKIERIDRALAAQPQFYKRTGTRKGARYTLTSAGHAYAARRLLELWE